SNQEPGCRCDACCIRVGAQMPRWRALHAGPTMNAPVESTARPSSTSRVVRRIAVAAVLGGLVFLVLWVTAFSLVTSLLIGSGCCAVIVLASTSSDLLEAVLDAVAPAVFAVLAAIAAVIAAIFSLFD